MTINKKHIFQKLTSAFMGICMVLCVQMALAGCKKKESTPPANPSTNVAQPNPVGKPSDAPIPLRQPVTALAKPNGSADVAELQRAVIRWVVANKRRPNNFEDFAKTAGVVIPPPPVGKKYILTQDLHVQLVNQ